MAYTATAINDLLERILKQIDISETMFQKANDGYHSLSAWINEHSDDYAIAIYPQGSFALGTVIKPITDLDDYDLDLVCEFSQQYALTAKQLKIDVVKPWLIKYRKVNGEIENKRRCWHVEYEDLPNFHMDIIPAYYAGPIIQITNHNEVTDTYSYIGSNPKGYIDWFFQKCSSQWEKLYKKYQCNNGVLKASADVETLDRYRVKTTLQKAIQLLKRHRDIMFSKSPECKPISILITTIAAELYKNEDDVFTAVESILSSAQMYIQQHKIGDEYFIENPSYPGENFADKWNTHPERLQTFIRWLTQAKHDLSREHLMCMDRLAIGQSLKHSFGENVGRKVFAELAKEEENAITSGIMRIDPNEGSLSKKGTVAIPANRHYHG